MFYYEEVLDDDINKYYDIIWDDERVSITNHNQKYDRIRGITQNSTYVAILFSEIEDCEYIIKNYYYSISGEYLGYYNHLLCNNPEIKIVEPTSARKKIDSLLKWAEDRLEYLSDLTLNLNERNNAWVDYLKWGPRGFLNDFMHDLCEKEGFEDTDYYDEGIKIIKHYNLIKL